MLASKPIQATGTATIIPAVAGRPIYVRRMILSADTNAATIQFQDTNGNNLTGQMTLAQGFPVVWSAATDSQMQDGILELTFGLGLKIVVSAGNVGGQIQYIQ